MKKEIIASLIETVNKRLDALQPQHDEAFKFVNTRIDNLEENVQSFTKQENTLIVKNVQLLREETNEYLHLQINKMFKELAIGIIVPNM